MICKTLTGKVSKEGVEDRSVYSARDKANSIELGNGSKSGLHFATHSPARCAAFEPDMFKSQQDHIERRDDYER